MAIRPAVPNDMPAITAILNDAILNTTAVWYDAPKTPDEIAAWHAARVGDGYPVLVFNAGRGVEGYATYGPFRAFPGYRLTAELSLYVEAGARGRGVGRALLAGLVETARDAGLRALIGGIEAENGASLALHRALGFEEVGRLPAVGQKFGRWLTLVFVQKTLDDRPTP